MDEAWVWNSSILEYNSLLVHGNWGEWSEFEQCNVTCGGGEQFRTRECEGAKHGGKDCLLSDGSGKYGVEEKERQTCNEQPCPGIIFCCLKVILFSIFSLHANNSYE